MRSNLKSRAFSALNLGQYSVDTVPDKIKRVELNPPQERQYILRMLIKKPFGGFQIPEEYSWMVPMLEVAVEHQEFIGIRHPFCYLTIRSGEVTSENDDEWHVDGFSLNISHLPEQNYIWSDVCGTEYSEQTFYIPRDFDGRRHNLHKYLGALVDKRFVKKCEEKVVYGLDPYTVHRRPKECNGVVRTFVRISFTPIEIDDVNNTYNPLLHTAYKRDGVKDFRDGLEEYKVINNLAR